ncbi:MAG: histidine kinase [Psychromonas sp.]|nr:histidine kinase [Chlorobium sp.]MCW8994700.1 histidine kinase [Psychromonas sp.]
MSREKKIPHNFQDSTKGQHPGKAMKLSRKQIYWVSQIAGWMFFVAINLFIISSIEELPWQRILVWIFLGALGILFTHLLRRIIRKKNWLNLPLKNTIPRVLLASIITGTIIYAFVFAASYIAGTMNQEEFNIARPLAGVINLGGITLLWSLIYFVVHYMENYKKKEIESLIWEAAVKDYELRTLKSQLNPHFMFNAMNSIRALIEEDPESAKVAITKLSNILRYSLQMERMERVPLEDEIETVKNYLDLERIRFEDRLNYKLDVDKATEKIEIPPMMIQTLVENGIKHGVSKQTRGGEIKLTSKVLSTENGSKLKIEIRNSGHFSEEQLKNSSGFGVSNTKHRLNLLFGENANFSIKNENGETVLAEVEIPIPTISG